MEFLNVLWEVGVQHGSEILDYTNLCQDLQGQEKPLVNSSQFVYDRDQSVLVIEIWWHGLLC